MFIDSSTLEGSSLQRSEMSGSTFSSANYIALRWSAKHSLAAKSINIWLLRSQNIV